MSAKVLKEDIETAEEEVEDLERRFLQQHHWKYTSANNPAHYWLWEKRLPDGRIVMVDTQTALKFEGCS